MRIGLSLAINKGAFAAAVLSPVLDYNFLTSGVALPSGVTLSRTDTAARYSWASNGILTALANGAPCFDWDSTGAAQGLRVEPLSKNWLPWSKRLDVWDASTNLTVNTGAADPKNGTAGFSLVPSAAAAIHNIYNGITVAAGTYCAWVLAKQSDALITGLNLLHRTTPTGQSPNVYGRYDLASPYSYFTTPLSSHISNMSTGVMKVGQLGWVLHWHTFTVDEGLDLFRFYTLMTDGENANIAGDGSSKILVSHGGICDGLRVPPNPIETTGSLTSNAADVPTISNISGINTTTGTFVVDHDLPGSGTLLKSQANTILTAPTRSFTVPAPRRTLIAYNSGGTTIYDDGVLSSTSGTPLTFGNNLTLGGSEACHIRRLRWYSQDLSA